MPAQCKLIICQPVALRMTSGHRKGGADGGEGGSEGGSDGGKAGDAKWAPWTRAARKSSHLWCMVFWEVVDAATGSNGLCCRMHLEGEIHGKPAAKVRILYVRAHT